MTVYQGSGCIVQFFSSSHSLLWNLRHHAWWSLTWNPESMKGNTFWWCWHCFHRFLMRSQRGFLLCGTVHSIFLSDTSWHRTIWSPSLLCHFALPQIDHKLEISGLFLTPTPTYAYKIFATTPSICPFSSQNRLGSPKRDDVDAVFVSEDLQSGLPHLLWCRVCFLVLTSVVPNNEQSHP